MRKRSRTNARKVSEDELREFGKRMRLLVAKTSAIEIEHLEKVGVVPVSGAMKNDCE